ncbi:DAM1 [Candida theae]|uniref:DASH complex subunit DAM1 n=1 Tax=Candida theae TaxID=1198502 RepID=A0AAD5G0E9_9ASCO|nr:DAM1 [Candida theae]KAI5965476.1 DAM1 [Candida theae]
MSNSRPTTPIGDRRQSNRRHSRRSSGIPLPSPSPHHYPIDPDNLPMDCPEITSKFRDLADGFEDLDVNVRDLNHIHDAVSNQFNESFASFLYGLSITMWCVDLPKCPSQKAWQRLQMRKKKKEHIAELRRKIEDAEKLNIELKEKLVKETRPVSQSRSSSARLPSSRRLHANDENAHPRGNAMRKPNSTATRVSRIPQPVRAYQPSIHSSSHGPNLNQPPRYMRGLFDNSGAATSIRKSNAPPQTTQQTQKWNQRPPFR